MAKRADAMLDMWGGAMYIGIYRYDHDEAMRCNTDYDVM